MTSKDADRKAYSVVPDQPAPRGAVLEEQSDLGLHCLLKPICPKTSENNSTQANMIEENKNSVLFLHESSNNLQVSRAYFYKVMNDTYKER